MLKTGRVGVIGSVFAEVDFLRILLSVQMWEWIMETAVTMFLLHRYMKMLKAAEVMAQFNEGQGWSYLMTWYNTLNFKTL